MTELSKQQTRWVRGNSQQGHSDCLLKSPLPKAAQLERGTTDIQTHISVAPKSLLRGRPGAVAPGLDLKEVAVLGTRATPRELGPVFLVPAHSEYLNHLFSSWKQG